LGKLRLEDGLLTNSTYLAELAEGTGALGTPHPDPNLDGWPNPNTGWPDVNTTRIAKNNLKVSSNGDVCVLAVGRRTITTANACQKMVKPFYGGLSCWNSFVRVYDPNFQVPKYSSLVVGAWDTLTQAGGGNTDLYGVYKTSLGVICVGRQTADTSGLAIGNNIPVTNLLPWGQSTPENESAILVYYQAENLYNEGDDITSVVNTSAVLDHSDDISIYPNPTSGECYVNFNNTTLRSLHWQYEVTGLMGNVLLRGDLSDLSVDISNFDNGLYILKIYNINNRFAKKIMVAR
jgi:hypothetical protein